MKNIALWMARQFDSGITLAGALIALLLVGLAIGALIGLTSGSLSMAAGFGVPFLSLLCLMFLAAHHTDANVRMSKHERRALWERTPVFVKRAIYVFAAGAIAGAMLEGWLAHFVSWALTAVSALMLAEGTRRERPPLPRANAEPLAEGESLAEYERLLKQTLWGFYVSAIVATLMALFSLRGWA